MITKQFKSAMTKVELRETLKNQLRNNSEVLGKYNGLHAGKLDKVHCSLSITIGAIVFIIIIITTIA